MKRPTPATTATTILGLWLLASDSTAFVAPHRNLKVTSAVPISPSSSGLESPSAFQHDSNDVGGSGRPSSTALHASGGNLFDRFFRVARGNLNTALSRFEDPEKVMDQALVDMKNDIGKIRRTYAEVTAGQRRLVSEKNQHEAVADDWYRRAQLALKSGKDNLAREALARREQALQKAVAVQQQLDTQRATLDKLYEGMTALEGKILDAQARKSQLAARAKTAKSTAQVNDMLNGLTSGLSGGSTSMDAFRRMEDKVVALETQAEVSAEMLNNALLASSSSGSKSDIEMEFRALEASDAVDQELQKLKKAMLPPASKASYEIEGRISRPTSRRVEVKALD